MLVTTKEMLIKAKQEGYAVGAFNVENMEMIQAVVRAAEELNSPVILQTTPSTVSYGELEYFYAIAKVAAEKSHVPVAVHLDHGNSFELAMRAIRAGYTSIMIDGSHESLEKNIELCKSVVAAASPNSIPVEAELGKVGGKEDGLDVKDAGLTDVNDAIRFVKETGISSLAVAIGTAHGIYVGKPKLDKERLSELAKVIDIPLVLHGASGICDEDVADCIERGISKVNYATELRIAFTGGVKQVLDKAPNTFDPKSYMKVGRENVVNLVKNRIIACKSAGKA